MKRKWKEISMISDKVWSNKSIIYLLKLFAREYMFGLAGQTAGLNWLRYFEGTLGLPGW